MEKEHFNSGIKSLLILSLHEHQFSSRYCDGEQLHVRDKMNPDGRGQLLLKLSDLAMFRYDEISLVLTPPSER